MMIHESVDMVSIACCPLVSIRVSAWSLIHVFILRYQVVHEFKHFRQIELKCTLALYCIICIVIVIFLVCGWHPNSSANPMHAASCGQSIDPSKAADIGTELELVCDSETPHVAQQVRSCKFLIRVCKICIYALIYIYIYIHLKKIRI